MLVRCREIATLRQGQSRLAILATLVAFAARTTARLRTLRIIHQHNHIVIKSFDLEGWAVGVVERWGTEVQLRNKIKSLIANDFVVLIASYR